MRTRRTTQRALAVLAVAALGLTLGACGRGGDTAAGGESRQLVLAVSTLNNPYFLELRDGAQKAADAAGAKLQVVDAQNDAATQANQLANAASQGVDAVLLNPVDSAAAGPAVAPLTSAKIPVVAVDRGVEGADVATTVASDNVAGGKAAAEALAKAVGDKGTVVVLQGVAGTSASRERGQGFTEGIAAHPGISVVASQPANFDRAQALDVTTNLLQANPDVVGVFAENDEMALGAIQALGSRAGSAVQVVGFDGTPDGLKAVQAATLAATVAQLPAELGATAVKQALSVLDGGTVPASVPVQVTLVDSTNVAKFTS